MFQVSQSTTGQFVVTHPASGTVMVGDDLAATYAQMRSFVAALGPAALVAATTEPQRSPVAPMARWLAVGALALLPFVWLGALHVSLGRLVSELHAAPAAAGQQIQPNPDLRARVERVERQIESLERPRAPAASGRDADEAALVPGAAGAATAGATAGAGDPEKAAEADAP